MKKIRIVLFWVVILFSGCGDSDVISVRLSLHETGYGNKHYLRVEVVNRSAEKVFVPHIYEPFMILHRGTDLTEWVYNTDLISDPIVGARPDSMNYSSNAVAYARFWDSVRVHEEELFLRLNLSEDGSNPEACMAREEFLVSKYDGIPLAGGDTAMFYYPLDELYDPSTGRPLLDCEIGFRRLSRSVYALYDTVRIAGYYFYTPLPKEIAGYEIYRGRIECSDKICLEKE